ncbi:class I adenylate-forming enzyme family protein [Chloroflexota bacterium]
MNLNLMLKNTIMRFAGKTAMVMGMRRVSYTELDEASNKVASALIGMGLKKGDRVATLQSNNPEFVTVFFGIIKAGGIAVPLDARYKINELASILNDCQPKVLVADNPPLDSLVPAIPRFGSIKHIIDLSGKYEGQFLSYPQIMAMRPSPDVNVVINPDDIAVISYTSEPTNNPLGVTLSHRSICTEAIISGDVFQQTDRDVVMQFALPMYHQFGLTVVLLASIAKGSTIVVVPGTGRSIDSFMEAVEREKGTMYMGIPYIYALAVNVARREGIKHDLSSLRLCISGGAPLEAEIINFFQQYYGFKLLDIYGQTESVAHITAMPINETDKIDSSGKPMPCWEIKIVDDNGNELPPNQPGEIIARGPIMTGFYNNPQATATTIKNGWLYTGDIGKIDEDGYLYITGRKRRLIILKGQNIFPSDIEDVLITHPKIAKVKVIGVPNIIRGETVKAIIRLKPGETVTEQEIRQFCQNRMADYKLPREITFSEILPEPTTTWTRQETS